VVIWRKELFLWWTGSSGWRPRSRSSWSRGRDGHLLPARLRSRHIARRDGRHRAPAAVYGGRLDLGGLDGALDASRRSHPVPRLALWSLAAGIVATVGANLAHGLDHGLVGAL